MKKLKPIAIAFVIAMTGVAAHADTHLGTNGFVVGKFRVGPDSNDSNEPNWDGTTTLKHMPPSAAR